MTLRVYVAGPSAELDRARAAMRMVWNLGAVVTHDWTLDASAWPQLTSRQLAEHVALDLAGVRAADVVLALARSDTHALSQGAAIEVGYALACGIRVVAIVGDSGEALGPWGCLPGVDLVTTLTEAAKVLDR